MKKDIKIDSKMKTIITNDWLKEFPEYKKLKPANWKKIVGPVSFSMGYDIRYSSDIRIAFSIFNLANAFDFTYATINKKPNKNYSITWKQHEEGRYKEAAEELRQQAFIPVEGPVRLTQIISAYIDTYEISALTNLRNLEDPVLICAWANQIEKAEECLSWSKSEYDKRFGGKPDFLSTEEWYNSMLKKISDPEGLRQTVEDQIAFHKLTKMPRQELIID